MAKTREVKTLVDIIGEMEKPKPKTWLDALSPEMRKEVLEVKAAHQAGKFVVSNLTIARELVKRLNLKLNPDHISRWLRDST